MVMVDVGGYRLDADVVGGRLPPVVFVTGRGAAKSTWAEVRPMLTCGSLTVTYDRPAIGASEARPSRRATYGEFATELVTLLDRLHIEEPAVFVGHSIGSLIVRMVAGTAPSRVSGMVHVDGTIPELIFQGDESRPIDGNSPDGTEIQHDVGTAEVGGAGSPFVPAIAMVQTPGRFTQSPYPDIDERWDRGQQHLCDATGAVRIDAVDAGHSIHRENPELVTFAIDAVVAAVRAEEVTVDLDLDQVAAVGGRLSVGMR